MSESGEWQVSSPLQADPVPLKESSGGLTATAKTHSGSACLIIVESFSFSDASNGTDITHGGHQGYF